MDLIKTVVDQDLCTGCGVCVSECNSGSLVMDWDDHGFLTPKRVKETISNDNLLRVCPFNPNPAREVEDEDKLAAIFLNEANRYDDKIGHFENTYVGYSNEFRDTSSSGGIATFVFEQLLKQKIAEHLFIVKEENGTYEYQLFSNEDQIKQISKTRYIPVTLDKLFSEIDKTEGRIAVSGVACFIKAIRLKQYYHPELKEKIPFLIGIICGGLKSRFFTDYLSQKAGIEGDYHKQEYRIKDADSLSSDYSFGAFDEHEKFYQMKMETVGDMWGTGLFKANACDFCTDVLTELADISLGDAWLDEYRKDGLGNSVIVTRSKVAEKIIREGIAQGVLSVTAISGDKIIQSQSSSFSHRRDAISLRIFIRRIQRKHIPYIRKRVFGRSSLAYKIVQLQRLRTRSASLKIWKDKTDAMLFDKAMMGHLKLLSILTRVYHKLGRLRILVNRAIRGQRNEGNKYKG